MGTLLAGLATAGTGLWAFMVRGDSSKAKRQERGRERRLLPFGRSKAPREIVLRIPEGWTWDDVRAYFQSTAFARQATGAPVRIAPFGRQAVRMTSEQLIPAGIMAARAASEQLRPLGAQAVQVAREQLVPRGAEALHVVQHELVPKGAELAKTAGGQVGAATVAAGETIRRTIPDLQARFGAGQQVDSGKRMKGKAATRAPSKGVAVSAAGMGSAVVAPIGSALGQVAGAILRFPLVVLGALWSLVWALFTFTFRLAMFAALVGLIFYLYFPEQEQREAFFDRMKGFWNRMTGASDLEQEMRPAENVGLAGSPPDTTWMNGEQPAG